MYTFESAAEFKEAGMAFCPRAHRPRSCAMSRTRRAVPMRGVRIMFAQGEAAGERLTSIVLRAAFLQELLAVVPQDRMYASKKLQKIDRDGTVRKLILGENDPATSPQSTDMENACGYGWIGHNVFLTHKILSGGQLVQFAMAPIDTEAEPGSLNGWQCKMGADEIKQRYRGFLPHLNKVIIELLCNQPEHNALYLWDHPKAHSYVDGPIHVTGDASHSTIPCQGSGSGMPIEDGFILSAWLGRAKSPAEVLTALKAYDLVRRPRTQEIVESSWIIGTMITGANEETGLDPKKFKSLMSRWDFIIDIDMEKQKHRDEALQMMEASLKRESIVQ
ncbi:salicylate hydroxylase [Annulohypoxylon truncatum]|uniref:salicylate hydroxylase n=1 Tax=Annulohypoxylon truncatum TaxID=327061 RepID=UPI0020088428|nr:salicylate hydroxylase [Annulohypoxylon truncatum]KAI1215130.1 salicylate hydroxylase [Annulohypoxylon truncatum]